MTLIAGTTLAFQSYKWWRPENGDPDRYGVPDAPRGRGLILLAARFEENVIGPTLERLAHLDYPDYLVAVIIDHPDDPATLAVARYFERRYPRRIRVIRYPEDTPVHNKPIGLNRALHDLEAMGVVDWDWVGVLDAEDLLHPQVLRDGRPPLAPDRSRHRAGRRPADELQLRSAAPSASGEPLGRGLLPPPRIAPDVPIRATGRGRRRAVWSAERATAPVVVGAHLGLVAGGQLP